MNTAFYWVTGVNTMGREIYLVFPPNYSSVKVEQEKNKLLKSYFAKLFMWFSKLWILCVERESINRIFLNFKSSEEIIFVGVLYECIRLHFVLVDNRLRFLCLCVLFFNFLSLSRLRLRCSTCRALSERISAAPLKQRGFLINRLALRLFSGLSGLCRRLGFLSG